MTLSVELVESEESFLHMREEWDELLNRCKDARIFSTYEWVRAAHLTRQTPAQPFIVKAYRDGRLVGIAPLCLVSSFCGLARIEHMASGGAGLADYLDFLCEPQFESVFLDAVFAVLGKEKSRWRFFDWQGLHAGVSFTQLRLSSQRAGLFILDEPGAAYYTAVLAPTWDEHLARLPKKLRDVIGNRRRKIVRERNAEFLRVVDRETLMDGIDAIQRLQNLRWGPDAHGDPTRFFQFIRALAPLILKRGWLDFRLLRAEGEYVAAAFTCVLSNTAFFYLTGCDVGERWSRYSVGTLITADAVRSAITQGCTTFDMLRGEHSYKERFLGVRQQSKRVVLASTVITLAYFRARWWARDRQRQSKELYRQGSKGFL